MHSSQQSRSKVGAAVAAVGPADSFSKQYLVNGWNHGVSINQNASVGDSRTLISSHHAEPPVFKETNSSVAAPKSSSLGKERLPETASSFHLSESYQPGTTAAPRGLQFASIGMQNDEVLLKGKKRKNSTQSSAAINPHSTVSSKSVQDEQRRDASPLIINNFTGKNDRILKNELKLPCASSSPTVKIASESSQEDNATKGDSFHSRAKRGQATNRHSLAERVRRERINERMRLLQDLVPGCNRVAGKAVMLDEIINYVQSLQCQVEFLAMKLATVNPGLNVDLEQILLKDMMLRSREGFSSILTSSPGASDYHAQLQGAMQSDTTTYCVSNPSDVPFNAEPQVSSKVQLSSGWDEELLNSTQLYYLLDPVVHGRKVP